MRAAQPGDAAAIQAIYAPVVRETVASFEEVPPSVAEISRRMVTAPRLPWLVAEQAGRVAGYAYASRHRDRSAYRWSADCSVYLHPQHQRQGVGRRLYEQLLAEVRELGYVSLFAGITLPNASSVGLHGAMGFEPVGVFRQVGFKHGAWHDVGWWRRALLDPPAAPREPREPREWEPR